MGTDESGERPGDLAGARVLLVGGGGNGNGTGIARALAAEGARVAVVDISAASADAVVAELTAGGADACAICADVRSQEDISRSIAETVARVGGVDVLVTVVGGQTFAAPWLKVHDTSDEQWEVIYDLNLRYVMRYVREVLPIMLAQGSGGSIVSIGSIAGVSSSPMSGSYGASKAGLINLARTVALEYGHAGIRMNVLSCGMITTPVTAPTRSNEWFEVIPLGRAADPAEVGRATVFLASSRSSYITGQNLPIDGGATLRAPFRYPGTDHSMAG